MQSAKLLVKQARKIRAGLVFKGQPRQSLALDVRLLSYKLQRSVKMHTILPKASAEELSSVMYRKDGKKWMKPQNVPDDQGLIPDLPDGLYPVGRKMLIEAKTVLSSGDSKIISYRLTLPRQDPRLFLGYTPGSIQGSVNLYRSRLRASLQLTDEFKQLLTSVRYIVYPLLGGAPLCLELKAGWFDMASPDRSTVDCKAPGRARGYSFKVDYPLPEKFRGPSLVKARVIFSRRLRESVPIYVGVPFLRGPSKAQRTH